MDCFMWSTGKGNSGSNAVTHSQPHVFNYVVLASSAEYVPYILYTNWRLSPATSPKESSSLSTDISSRSHRSSSETLGYRDHVTFLALPPSDPVSPHTPQSFKGPRDDPTLWPTYNDRSQLFAAIRGLSEKKKTGVIYILWRKVYTKTFHHSNPWEACRSEDDSVRTYATSIRQYLLSKTVLSLYWRWQHFRCPVQRESINSWLHLFILQTEVYVLLCSWQWSRSRTFAIPPLRLWHTYTWGLCQCTVCLYTEYKSTCVLYKIVMSTHASSHIDHCAVPPEKKKITDWPRLRWLALAWVNNQLMMSLNISVFFLQRTAYNQVLILVFIELYLLGWDLESLDLCHIIKQHTYKMRDQEDAFQIN